MFQMAIDKEPLIQEPYYEYMMRRDREEDEKESKNDPKCLAKNKSLK